MFQISRRARRRAEYASGGLALGYGAIWADVLVGLAALVEVLYVWGRIRERRKNR